MVLGRVLRAPPNIGRELPDAQPQGTFLWRGSFGWLAIGDILQPSCCVDADQIWATLIPPAVVHSVGKYVDLEECGIRGGAGNDGKAGNSYMTVLRRK